MNFVYCAHYAPGQFKIGYSANPEIRCQTLATGSYFRPKLTKTWLRPKGDGREVEHRAHNILAEFWVWHKNYTKEVFKCTRQQAHDGIERAVWLTDGPPRPKFPPFVQKDNEPFKLGYAPIGVGNKEFAKIAAAGVDPALIYDDAPRLAKALRAGDVLILNEITPLPWPAQRLAERGITFERV